MNPQACLYTILLIFLNSSVVFAGEYCYFRGHIVNYCPTGRHCCSRLRDRCCRDKIRGFSVWAIVFISVFSLALIVAGIYMIIRRLKSKKSRVENGVATSNIHAVPAFNVPTATLYPQGQQRIAMVFASYPRQQMPAHDEDLPPPYQTEDLPPVYPGCTKA